MVEVSHEVVGEGESCSAADADAECGHGEDDSEHLLDDTWTLYFHEPSDSSWTMSSYLRLDQISSIESFWQVHEGVRKYLSRGMFFLMREHVFPCWDDPNNIRGGCISIKVLKEDLESFWEQVVIRMLGDRLILPPKQDSCRQHGSNLNFEEPLWTYVNGVSTSPKRFFCICKIWLKEGAPTERQFFELPRNFHGEPLFRSNIENIKHNNP
jgi:hypothetical protein